MFSGLLIAIAFGVGHNGMPVFDADKKPGFAELAVRTAVAAAHIGNDERGSSALSCM